MKHIKPMNFYKYLASLFDIQGVSAGQWICSGGFDNGGTCNVKDYCTCDGCVGFGSALGDRCNSGDECIDHDTSGCVGTDDSCTKCDENIRDAPGCSEDVGCPEDSSINPPGCGGIIPGVADME